MNSWPDTGEASVPAAMLLDQAEMAVIVTDRRASLLYVNAYALRLLEVPGDTAPYIGQSVLSIGFGEDQDRWPSWRAACCTAGPGRARSPAGAGTAPAG